MKPLKILFKYPSRGRKSRFFDGLDSIVNNMQDLDNFHIACTLDDDDEVMHSLDVMQAIAEYPNTSVSWGKSYSKIHAINRDMPNTKWDILVVMSDDMRIKFYGFDTMLRLFVGDWQDPKNGILIHVPDQDAKSALATMYIATRPYYERFGYVYHPSYKSLWCDNEAQDVAKMIGCYRFADWQGVIEHLNPAYGTSKHLPRDEMFDAQQAFWAVDEENYKQRKAKNFDIETIKHTDPNNF
jgi:hypothetical protein